jgi:dTDP-4-dehydrorhamnose reductase
MLKILITGSNGQLGSELKTLAPEYPSFSFDHTDLPELDITDSESVKKYFLAKKPDVLINCAAYTAVDGAESEPEIAGMINHLAVKNLAEICEKMHCFPVHLSTDYVFDGGKNAPYNEDDIPNPLSVYGKTKLAGEVALMSAVSRGIIFRTSWLYSSFGHNFVKTIIKKSRETDRINVVNDQSGRPTYAHDLAKAILDILPEAIRNTSQPEILHYANEGVCTWFDLAKAIIDKSRAKCTVYPILTSEYPVTAARPPYSVLGTSKIKELYKISIPFWRDSLNLCIERIVS